MADATTNADGTLTFDHDPASPDAAAYPLPMLTYALVPTKPQTPATAAAMKKLLVDVLSITGGSKATNVADLPPGYFRLPTSVASQAVTDVATDIRTQSPTTPSPSTTEVTTAISPTPDAGATNPPPVPNVPVVAAATGSDSSSGPRITGPGGGSSRRSTGPQHAGGHEFHPEFPGATQCRVALAAPHIAVHVRLGRVATGLAPPVALLLGRRRPGHRAALAALRSSSPATGATHQSRGPASRR